MQLEDKEQVFNEFLKQCLEAGTIASGMKAMVTGFGVGMVLF